MTQVCQRIDKFDKPDMEGADGCFEHLEREEQHNGAAWLWKAADAGSAYDRVDTVVENVTSNKPELLSVFVETICSRCLISKLYGSHRNGPLCNGLISITRNPDFEVDAPTKLIGSDRYG